VSGFGSLSNVGESGGVAYMAHVGGFVAGVVLVFLFRNPVQPPRYRRAQDY
jgi:membrane associated rhomboid family serine protease